jgi:GPH family glycoside/pentoside/hexuronide:cation symporter
MTEEKLSLKLKLAYGGLGAGINLPSQITFSAITFFYNIILGLDAALIGIAWLIFSFWNALNDPIFGFIEDNTKSEKYGRRIPYIRFGAPIYGLGFIFCWIPFVDTNNEIVLFINLVIVLFVFDTLFTILGLINYTLPAELALTVRARGNLLLYSNIITSISILISYILPIVFLTGNESPDAASTFLVAMICVGIISVVILLISSFHLKENKYTQMEPTLPVIQGIKETFKNKPFLIFEIANFSFTIAQTILTTAIFYYIEYVLQLTGFFTMLPLILVFLMIFVFIFVFNFIIRKIGVKKTFIIALFWTGISFLLLFFIGWIFELALMGFILIGVGISGYMLSNQVVVADIIDYDEIRTNKRRETTYSGINALITKPAISLANWLFLIIISIFGFNDKLTFQDFDAKLGIMIAFNLIPFLFLIIGAIVMFFYPLDGSHWLAQKEKLIKIHHLKEKEYIKYLESNKKDIEK